MAVKKCQEIISRKNINANNEANIGVTSPANDKKVALNRFNNAPYKL